MIQTIRRIPTIKDLPGVLFNNEQMYTCSFNPAGDNDIIDVSLNVFGGKIFIPTLKSDSQPRPDYWEIVEKTPPYLHVHYCTRCCTGSQDIFKIILTIVYFSTTGEFITSHVPISDKTYLTPNLWLGTEYVKSITETAYDERAYLKALAVLKEHYHLVQRINIHYPECGSTLNDHCRNAEELVNAKNKSEFLSSWVEEIFLTVLGRKHGTEIDSSILLKNTKANTCFTGTDLEAHCDIRCDIDPAVEFDKIVADVLSTADLITTGVRPASGPSSMKNNTNLPITHSILKNERQPDDTALTTNQLIIHLLMGICTDLHMQLKYDASVPELYITKGTYGNRYSEQHNLTNLVKLDDLAIELKRWTIKLITLVIDFVTQHLPEEIVKVDTIEITYVPCTITITVLMKEGADHKKYAVVIPILEVLPSVPIFDSETRPT